MFKNARVVLLTTNQKSNIHIAKKCNDYDPHNKDLNIYTPYLVYKKDLKGSHRNTQSCHLYIATKDEIKDNDFVLHWMGSEHPAGNFVFQCKKVNNNDKTHGIFSEDTDNLREHCFKIIATTDTSLNIKHNCECGATTFEGCSECIESLPKPSKSFVDKFISEYNKGNVITECLVEYDCDHLQMPQKVIDILKVDKDNEITIRKIKYSYTKDEVEKLAKSAFMAGYQVYTKQDVAPISIFDKWLKEEL